MNSPPNIQTLLFHLIRDKIPADLSFVHEIAELLKISYDSAYRRIRAEKELTLDEFRYMVAHYGLSADALFETTQANVLFTPRSFQKNKASFFEWLLNETRSLSTTDAGKGLQAKDHCGMRQW